MPAAQDSQAGLPDTPKPPWAGHRARPPAKPPWDTRSSAEHHQLMFSRAGAGRWRGAAEGNVGQRLGVRSAQEGGVSPVQTQAPQQAVTSVEPAGGAPGGAGRAAQGLGGGAADGGGAGDRGAGEDRGRLSAQTTVASLFKRYK